VRVVALSGNAEKWNSRGGVKYFELGARSRVEGCTVKKKVLERAKAEVRGWLAQIASKRQVQ